MAHITWSHPELSKSPSARKMLYILCGFPRVRALIQTHIAGLIIVIITIVIIIISVRTPKKWTQSIWIPIMVESIFLDQGFFGSHGQRTTALLVKQLKRQSRRQSVSVPSRTLHPIIRRNFQSDLLQECVLTCK